MAPNTGGKATWPSNLQGRLSKQRHENIYAHTNAFLAVALELKAIQDGAGSHGPPKGVFQPFLDAVIELVGRFQEAPSVEDLTKDITELKSLVSKQTKDQLQLVKSVNALGSLRTGALTPVSGPPCSWLEAARRGAALGTTTTTTSGSYVSNWLGAAYTKGSTVPSTVTRTSGSPAPVLPLTADLELHVRKTTPLVVNPFRHNYQKLVDEVNRSIAESGDKMISHRKVVASRVLPSRDVILTVDNMEDAERLQRSTSTWPKVLGSNAVLKRRGYPVAVHHQCQPMAATPTEITYVGWVRPWKTVVGRDAQPCWWWNSTTTAQPSGDRQGLILDGKQHDATAAAAMLWLSRIRHIIQHCRKALACAYCGQEHSTQDCVHKDHDNRRKHAHCVLCGGKHYAFDRKCPVKRQQIKIIRQKKATCPPFFPETPWSGIPVPATDIPMQEPELELTSLDGSQHAPAQERSRSTTNKKVTAATRNPSREASRSKSRRPTHSKSHNQEPSSRNKSWARDRNKRIRRNTLDGKDNDDVMATGN
ncbi:uncharacterized protein ATNIH1004_011621 [Aspergillus tanneri]|uniref:CCHC-type domain-containing protein n=1 Tax=Aspergillus tanneri TaxID=1220188 RepID=A0A5M9MAH9_9EURO|nr:uncharacterized protein ATNIH1004_011621 [Aspergillus tanneri]KAA8642676.1 hypothetical protein ATNIH1004_011621 [Aspergillus tanneri]